VDICCPEEQQFISRLSTQSLSKNSLLVGQAPADNLKLSAYGKKVTVKGYGNSHSL